MLAISSRHKSVHKLSIVPATGVAFFALNYVQNDEAMNWHIHQDSTDIIIIIIMKG